MTKRREGWYWVRDGYLTAGIWVALEWAGGSWKPHGSSGDYEEIGPRIPTPDEDWQCVPVEPTREMLAGTRWARAQVWESMLAAAPKPEDG